MFEGRMMQFPLAFTHFSPAALEVHLKTPNWRVVPYASTSALRS